MEKSCNKKVLASPSLRNEIDLPQYLPGWFFCSEQEWIMPRRLTAQVLKSFGIVYVRSNLHEFESPLVSNVKTQVESRPHER